MSNFTKFRVNSPKVVHEMIDGEVVIVNLEKGDYYSLVRAGADVCENLTNGCCRGEIFNTIHQRYDGERETIETAINEFLDQLQREGIISLAETEESNLQDFINSNTTPLIATAKLIFEAPSLQKYTDMEELLALDPIHDVDEEVGWPSAKVEA